MQDQDRDEVGDVTPDANHVPEEPVVEDGKRRPVLVIRVEETAQIASGAPRDEHPFVGDEPLPVKVPKKRDEDKTLGCDESPERRSLVSLDLRRTRKFTRFILRSVSPAR